MNRHLIKILLFSLGAFIVLARSLFGAVTGVSTPDSIEPSFETYCYVCHDANAAKAKIYGWMSRC